MLSLAETPLLCSGDFAGTGVEPPEMRPILVFVSRELIDQTLTLPLIEVDHVGETMTLHARHVPIIVRWEQPWKKGAEMAALRIPTSLKLCCLTRNTFTVEGNHVSYPGRSMFQTSSVIAYVSRFVAAGLLLGGTIACSKLDPTETAAYLDSLPRMTDGLVFYLPPGQQSRQTKDRLFLWARDAATGKSLFFEGEARYMGAPNQKWEGSTRFFSSQVEEATLRAASTATVYTASAEIVTELSNAAERDVFVSSIHDGEYVERPHCLQCGCARPALRRTAELLCPGQHAGELCGGLKAIAYALDSDQVATVKFRNSDYCRWVLSENGDVILQRQSSSQPSSNISEEIPGLIVENHQEQLLQPKSCNPEEPVGVLPEKRLYRFDGTLLWWRRSASRDPIAEVSEGTACYPDVRVVFSGLKPELLDEPPTRPVYWQER